MRLRGLLRSPARAYKTIGKMLLASAISAFGVAVIPGYASAAQWSSDPITVYTAYQWCEPGCATYYQEVSLTPAAYYQPEYSGQDTQIYQDSMESIFWNNSTNPVEPYMASWAEGQFINNTAVWVMGSDTGGYNGGCYNNASVAEPSNQVLCAISPYNTNGTTFTTGWNVQGGFSMGTYQVDTSCVQDCGVIQEWTP